MPGYTLTVRSGPKVERQRFADVASALAELEARARGLAATADGRDVDLKVRRIEPVQRVIARIELSGPRRLRAGIDVRGDGSAESYTGRLRRTLINRRGGESPYDALRRAVASG